MYINPSQYGAAFADIKRTLSSHSACKLILFVSCLSIDSICTAKIMSLVLKKNLIQYQLIPVVGYTDLKQHYTNLDADVSNILLIGCGAMIDLEAFLEIEPSHFEIDPLPADLDDLDLLQSKETEYRRKLYVIDGSRPWNLDNLFGSDMVICLDDGYVDQNLRKEKESYYKLVNEDETNTDSDNDEKDGDSDGSDVGDSDDNREGGESDSGSGDEKNNGGEDGRKHSRKRKRDLQESEEILENYYNQGTALFTACTAVVYALLATIGETSLDNLWISIVGVSSLDRVHPEVYDKIQPLYKEEVLRLNPLGAVTERNADLAHFAVEKDYRLFLLRHWTLYDSFFYLSHVNSKLNLWREDGKKKLHKLFAKMGISLSVAQQSWLYMDISVKRNLPVIFNKYLPLYGLEGIVREGFIRTFGYMGQLSAMECVEALTALLEYDERAVFKGDSNARVNSKTSEADEVSSKIEQKEKLWVNNFWSAWDALNMGVSGKNQEAVGLSLGKGLGQLRKLKGFDLLTHGFECAKSMQQIVFRTGMSVLERNVIKNLRLYRLCVLNDGSIPDLDIFNNPMILAKLGNWLLENINEAELAAFFAKKDSDVKMNVLKPLVIASLDIVTDTYLVIGLAPKYPRALDNSTKAKLSRTDEKFSGRETTMDFTTRLNTFSVAFQKVAANSGAKVRINSFDLSIIEIRKDDLSPFLEKLTLSGLI